MDILLRACDVPPDLMEFFEPTDNRARRDVFTIPTEPYAEAHFATFPQALVKPCILAGTSEKGCCVECGGPWVREMERTAVKSVGGNRNNRNGGVEIGWSNAPRATVEYETLGWRPSCSCNAETQGCLVLDPFAGSCTVGLVALNYGRRFVGIELNPEYAEMGKRRMHAAENQGLLDFANAGVDAG